MKNKSIKYSGKQRKKLNIYLVRADPIVKLSLFLTVAEKISTI